MKRTALFIMGTGILLAVGSALGGCEQGPGPRGNPVESSKMFDNPQDNSGAGISGADEG